MTQYLISFGAHAMDFIPGEDMPAVAKAAHTVAQEAIKAGVYVSATQSAQRKSRPSPAERNGTIRPLMS